MTVNKNPGPGKRIQISTNPKENIRGTSRNNRY